MKRVRGDLGYLLLLILFIGLFFSIDLYMANINGTNLNSKLILGYLGSNSIAILLSIILLIPFCYFILKNKLYLSGGLVATGATVNILDRIFFGGVPDYFNFYFIPTFNIADILIVSGLLLSVIFYIKKSPQSLG